MRRLTVFLIFTVCAIGTGSLLSPSPAWCNIQFKEVSQQAGITRIGESWGNAWGDFDGDGYLDLWATNHKHKPSLYRNNGDGTFTDIIDEVWDANPHTDTHGVAWADFDNDGDQDLVVLSGSGGGINATNARQKNHLYVNENGTLIEHASALGIDFPLLRGRTPLWLDFNKDGRLDLLLTGIERTTRTGGLVTSTLFQQVLNCCDNAEPAAGLVTSTLFQQAPTGFQDVSTATGLLFKKSSSLAQLADVTKDGNMELILHGNPYPAEVYHISVTPFQQLTATLNMPKRYNVLDAVFADFNGDLSSDVFLARGNYRSYIATPSPQRIQVSIFANMEEKGISFKTDGDVFFQIYSVWATRLSQVFIGAGGHRLTEFDGEFIGVDPVRNAAAFKFVLSPEDPRSIGLKNRPAVQNYGIYVGYDIEMKEWTVLYHTMPAHRTIGSVTMDAIIEASQPISKVEPINFKPAELAFSPQSILLINRLNGFETANTSFSGDAPSVTHGDFDNDMDVDIYVVRSSNAGNLPNHLYENQGNGTFVQVSGAGGAEGSPDGKGQSVTMADYDRDGYLDLFVTNGRGAWPFNEGPDQLFRNIGTGNNWLQIDLEGTVSNRDGIGARIFATTPDGKTQLRENGGGIHWCQQDQKRIHFGLAQNEKVSELVIHWPSGTVQKLWDIPANQLLHVVEAPTASRPGDVNQDGLVNILDFASVVKHFGETPPTEARTDVNGDGTVNILDLVWMLNATKPKK